MDIEYINPKDLVPYSKNAKKHPSEQVKRIAKSIKEFGFRQPIVIDKDNDERLLIKNVNKLNQFEG